jgi:hypothetical protein
LSALLDGNKEFKSSSKLSIAQNLTQNGPGRCLHVPLVSTIKSLAEPLFMIFECADNRFAFSIISCYNPIHKLYRVTAGTIFHATLGTIFSQHNLGNLYSQTDPNACVESCSERLRFK